MLPCCTATIRSPRRHMFPETAGGPGYCRFLKGNIQRLVNALAESHRLSLQTRYQVDYIETLYGLVRSKLAVGILPQLYTTHLQDPQLKVVHLQQPALARTVALMRARRRCLRSLNPALP